MTKLHHELGLKTLPSIGITSEVIIEVPALRVVVVGGGPGRLQPVQVGDQRLHQLGLHQLAARGLDRGWVPLPKTNIYSSFETIISILFQEENIFRYLRKYFNFYLTFI